MSAEIDECDVAEWVAAKLWEILIGRIRQGEPTHDLRIGCKGGGEGLTDGANLEERAIGYWLSCSDGSHPVVKDITFP